MLTYVLLVLHENKTRIVLIEISHKNKPKIITKLLIIDLVKNLA